MGSSSAVICIIGVSGAGKTTLVEALRKKSRLYRSPISQTTRPMRVGEEDGVDYHFVDRSDFEDDIAEGKFVEYTLYNGHYYGTPYDELTIPGRIALHVVEDDGALQLQEKVDALIVAVVPPSDDERLKRMTARGDSEEAVRQRIVADAKRNQMVREIADKVIVNDDFERSSSELHTWIQNQIAQRT